MNMFCQQCGNSLPPESLFCNRCGAKTPNQSGVGQRRFERPSPPRPARRAPITHAPNEESFEEYEYEDKEDYPERREEEYREGASSGKDNEHVIFSISPAFYEVLPSYLLAVVLSLIVTAAVAYLRGPLVIALVGIAIFFIRPIVRHIQLKYKLYTLTATKLEIRSGIFSKVAQSIPLRHIENVEVSETLKERLIGIGDVLIDSAALDSKMVMDNIKNPRKYADLIMNQLHHWN
jgi:membrane protein YdbS with pleckstrin-like domain